MELKMLDEAIIAYLANHQEDEKWQELLAMVQKLIG